MPKEYVYPSSDVTTQWTGSTGASHYTEVDEDMASPNDLDYIDDSGANHNDDFEHANFVLAGATSVNNVTIHIRVKTNDTGNCRALLYVNGTRYGTTNADPGAAYSVKTLVFADNPDTSLPWVIADVKGVGSNPIDYMGIRSVLSAGQTVHCSQEYVSCDYENGAGKSQSKTGLLMGVY